MLEMMAITFDRSFCYQNSFNASSPIPDDMLLRMSRRSCDGRRSPMPPGLTISRKRMDFGNSYTLIRRAWIAS